MWSIAFSNVSLSKFVKNVLLTYLLIPLGKKKKKVGTLEKVQF